MKNHIDAATLTTFDVHPDGTHVRINVRDHAGLPATLVLPAACANQLMMTLPAIVEAALRNSYKNDELRLVHPLAGYHIELGEIGEDGIQRFILTIDTGSGFRASFAVSEEMLTALARTIFSDVSGHDTLGSAITQH